MKRGGFSPGMGGPGKVDFLSLLAGAIGLGALKLIGWLKEPSASEYRARMPQQYWYDSKEDRVVVSDIPPSSTASSVLSIYDPDEARVDLDEVKKEYIQQEKDAFNPAYRRDGGTYNSTEKRKDRQHFYDNQKPTMTLKKLHRKMETLNNRDPNHQRLLKRNGGMRLPSWLPVVTPDNFSYTTVIPTNFSTQGLLHSLIRHGDQFFQNGLSSDIGRVLPEDMQQMVTQLRVRNEHELNTQFDARMLSMEDEHFEALLNLQLETRELIQKYVTQRNYLGESINTNGQQQVYFRVGESSTVMVLALSEQLYLGQEDCDTEGRKRPIRKIITVFFTKMEDVDMKRRKDWPVTKKF